MMGDPELAADERRAIDAKSAGPGAHTPIIELLLRLSATVLTVVSLSLIASDQYFNTVPAFNYLLGTTVLSFLYCFFESVVVSYHLATSGRFLLPFTFHIYFTVAADLVCSILLLSGSSAAFGVTTIEYNSRSFIAQANGSASLAFIAFIVMLPLVVLSSLRFFIHVSQK